LKPTRVDALVAAYQSGRTMKELAAEFGINRRTVPAHLRRAGVPIRRGGLDHDQVAEAASLDEAGWSSGRLAERFDVSADSVLKSLLKPDVVPGDRRDIVWTVLWKDPGHRAGVSIRPRQGGLAPKGQSV
jgi:hypothetical protein